MLSTPRRRRRRLSFRHSHSKKELECPTKFLINLKQKRKRMPSTTPPRTTRTTPPRTTRTTPPRTTRTSTKKASSRSRSATPPTTKKPKARTTRQKKDDDDEEEEEEEEDKDKDPRGKKRRSASPLQSPSKRSTRAARRSGAKEENEEETPGLPADGRMVQRGPATTKSSENRLGRFRMEVEARERAETERDALREQLVALKTRHAAMEKKVMDDEGDELEDLVKEENEVIEKMRKRLEKAETVNAELEMEVADLRGKRNERKMVEARLEEALEVNAELRSALEVEKKTLLESNGKSLPKTLPTRKGKGYKNFTDEANEMKELLQEKEQTIKILRQEMKSLEASASRGDMLSSKMVSVKALEERVQSTEAKLLRATENVRAKEIENEKLQRALTNAGKWSSSLLQEGPEELKNRVGALQTETIALSTKLVEATKALRIEQTKRELFESKAKEEEKVKDALEKELETVKIDALNAKSIVASKDSEISSLQKMAQNEKKGEKILQTKSSPFSNEIIRGLEKEITKLKNSKQNIDNTANNTNDTHSEIEMLQKKEQRLRVAFQSTVLKFREAVKLLFGFNIELVGEKASKTQFLITSNADENATLLFNYDEAKRSVSLDKNDPSWEKQTESLKKNFEFYVEKDPTDFAFGVPAFLSNWNIEQYNAREI